MIEVCCAIDLGTSGVKVSFVDAQGRTLRRATVEYSVDSPRPGWAQIDPTRWVDAVGAAVGECLRPAGPAVRIVCVGLDGQMHGLVLVDAAGKALGPAVLWPDSRAVEVLPQWYALAERVRADLANPIVPGMAGPILTWLRRHHPELVDQSEAVVSPKDWLRLQLTGSAPATDPSDASATLMWDVPAADWHADVMSELGLPRRLLPPVQPSGASGGMVTSRAAVQFGLPEGVPVAVGCADAASTLFALQPGDDEALVIVGTGIQVIAARVEPRANADPWHHTFTGADGLPYAMIAPQNGGLALGQVRRLLNATWDEVYAALMHSPAPARLGFSPWFSADRLPRPTVAGVGGWSGLGLETTRAQLLRAALESIAFSIRESLEAMPRPPVELLLAGGGTRDPGMQQLIADVTGCAVRRSPADDASALGAARLGWTALSARPPVFERHVGERRIPNPDAGIEARYAAFLARHRQAYA